MSDPSQLSGFSQLVAELRRRHVVRFAFGYAAAAFVVLQLAEIVFPAFGLGEGQLRLLVIAVGLGFPPALVLAWMYDITTAGIKRTESGGSHGPIFPRLAVGALLLATMGAAAGVGLYLDRQGAFAATGGSEASRPSALRLATYDATAPIRSIAVLPFADYSPGGDQAYFTAGLHDEIIAKLSALEQIRVVSRTSVMRYASTTLSIPEIGRDLDVDVVVEGSVTRSGTRTRVTLQLIHAPSESHIETIQFDREDVSDILSFQTEVAHEVVHKIAPHDESRFAQTVASVEPAAQDAYLRGRFEYNRGTADGYRMAMDYFEQALVEDPEFAPAMAGIAGARFLIGLEDTADISREVVVRAHGEASNALALDSTSVEAREVLTLIERSMPAMAMAIPAPNAPAVIEARGVAGGLASLDSLDLNMSAFDTAWATAMTSLGERIEERVRQRRGAFAGSDAGRAVFEARQRMTAGRFTEAARLLEEAVADDPDFSPAWDLLAQAHIASGEPLDALQAVDGWQRSGAPGAPNATQVQALRDSVSASGIRGYWSWRLARLEAQRALGEEVSAVDIAAAHAGLGHADAAFEALQAAVEAQDPALLTLRSDPVWDDLRSDDRFAEIGRQARELRFGPRRRPPGVGGPR